MYFVIALLVVVAILFATDKIRPDFIALAALVVLIFSGTLSADEALLAFGNPTVLLVATLFIIGQGLTLTGITRAIGNAISLRIRAGQENRLISILIARHRTENPSPAQRPDIRCRRCHARSIEPTA